MHCEKRLQCRVAIDSHDVVWREGSKTLLQTGTILDDDLEAVEAAKLRGGSSRRICRDLQLPARVCDVKRRDERQCGVKRTARGDPQHCGVVLQKRRPLEAEERRPAAAADAALWSASVHQVGAQDFHKAEHMLRAASEEFLAILQARWVGRLRGGEEAVVRVLGVVSWRRRRDDHREMRVGLQSRPWRELAEALAVLWPRLRGERWLLQCSNAIYDEARALKNRQSELCASIHSQRNGLLVVQPMAKPHQECFGLKVLRQGRRHVDDWLAPALIDLARGHIGHPELNRRLRGQLLVARRERAVIYAGEKPREDPILEAFEWRVHNGRRREYVVHCLLRATGED
mmetsp:Transcript_40276/g.110845  ORF Transcript_40276/g.110845 Transcript_40276/m.110845 type:complete len:344 (-) Transcript_40276:1023-2054(-)